ncbi:MAG: YbhN family protein [Dehalococcoidia bacterium]
MGESIERSRPWERRPVRWLMWIAVASVVAAFLVINRGEWRAIGEAARQARPEFLVLAALLQVGWMFLFGASFWAGLIAAGVRLPFRGAMVASWACNFLNMVVKSGGMSGLAVFIRAAGRRGYRASRVTLGYLLTLALGYAAFLVVLGIALVLLSRQGGLRRLELAASSSLALLIFAALAGLFLAVRSQHGVRRSYNLLAAVVNWISRPLLRRSLLDPDGGIRAAEESAAVRQLIRSRPAGLVPSALASLGKDLAGAAVLYAVLSAFYEPATPALAFAAYAMTIVFSYISIVPSGLGIVEISLTGLLIRAGVPPAAAALSTVVYRLFQFWAPFLIGAAATRFTGGATTALTPDPSPVGTGEGSLQ